MRNVDFPEVVKDHIFGILEEECDFIGEKPIQQGFLVKRNKDRATITYDDGNFIYAVKLIKNRKEWETVGVPSKWDNIQELLHMN